MHLLRRRGFVAGLGLGAGAHLLLPLCRGLIKEATGQPLATRRLVLFIPEGGQPRDYGEKIVTPIWPRPMASGDFELTEPYAAFAPHKQDMIFIDALSDPLDPELHGNRWSLLTARGGSKSPTGPSIDRYLAQKIGGRSPFPSLGFHQKMGGDLGDYHRRSCDGPDQPVPDDEEPHKAFAKIFGGPAAAGAATPTAAPTRDPKIFAFLRNDIARLRGRLAAPERAKLDQYLESLRALEEQARLLGQAQLACSKSGGPDAGAYKHLWWRNPELLKTGMQAWLDLTVSALACNMTNIVVVRFEEGELKFLGNGVGSHGMWHGGTLPNHLTYYKFMNEQALTMWERLKTFREGNGTLADNTLFGITNMFGGPHHGGGIERYFVLLATPGGAFRSFRPGRYLAFPKGGRPFPGDLFTSIANAMGVPGTFGDPTLTKGPLPGLG